MRKWMLIFLLASLSHAGFGQLLPERRPVRQGNRAYERENYVEAETKYMGALSKNPLSYEGNFNLGDAYYRQGRFEEAEKRFEQLNQLPADAASRSATFYNQGNSLVQQYKPDYNRQKLEQALEAYKNALRVNPDDPEAKFNLAYVQKLLEKEDGDGGGGGDDQNDDQNPDQQDQGGGGGGGDQEQDQDQDPNESDGDQNDQGQDQNQQPQPREGAMSREEAEQMLNAIQNGEEGARDKMEGQPAGAVGSSGKNW